MERLNSIPPPVGSRGLVFLALNVIALIFLLAAFGTNVASAKVETPMAGGVREFKTWFDIWYQCSRTKTPSGTSVASCMNTADPENTCTPFKDHFRATRCFYVLTAILIVVSFTAAILDHVRSFTLPGGLKQSVLLAVVGVVTVVISLIAWAIAVSLPRTEFCGSAKFIDLPNFAWGASPFMMLIVMIIAIVQVVAALLLGDAASAKSQQAAQGVPIEREQISVDSSKGV